MKIDVTYFASITNLTVNLVQTARANIACNAWCGELLHMFYVVESYAYYHISNIKLHSHSNSAQGKTIKS